MAYINRDHLIAMLTQRKVNALGDATNIEAWRVAAEAEVESALYSCGYPQLTSASFDVAGTGCPSVVKLITVSVFIRIAYALGKDLVPSAKNGNAAVAQVQQEGLWQLEDVMTGKTQIFGYTRATSGKASVRSRARPRTFSDDNMSGH